jgi:acetyl esterase/lipase
MNRIPLFPLLLSAFVLLSSALAEQTSLQVKRDIPYAEPADPLQILDVYAPPEAKNLPVVVWIHGAAGKPVTKQVWGSRRHWLRRDSSLSQ